VASSTGKSLIFSSAPKIVKNSGTADRLIGAARCLAFGAFLAGKEPVPETK
jgi:hypothetical protein